MKVFICNEIAIPCTEQLEKDGLVNRILEAGESVHAQSIYASNVQELLSRLTAEGYQVAPMT